MRIKDHPVLGPAVERVEVKITVDGDELTAFEGEPVAAALLASGRRICRTTPRFGNPRGAFCAIGQCTDCMMTVDGRPNVRTCVTRVRGGMTIETQSGLGEWTLDESG